MKFPTRKSPTSGRVRGYLVAALLLPAALLLQAEVAAAQGSPEPPAITVYHSLDPLGADPRSETVPAGCDEVSGAGGGTGGWVVVVGDVNTSDNLVFFSNVLEGGSNVLAARGRGYTTVGWIIDYYNTLPGVTATVTNTTITTAALAGVDLLMFHQTDFDLPLVYTPAELTAISDFLANGGNVLSVIETDSQHANFNAYLSGIGSTIQVATSGRGGGSANVVPGAPFTAGMGTEFVSAAHNTLTGGTTVATRTADGQAIAAVEQIGGSGAPVTECVIGGGVYEELKLWIDAGPTHSGEGEYICSKDVAPDGDSGEFIEGGNGDEICGAALTFQIQGIGRFREAIAAPVEVDAGIATMVLGTDCVPGEGDGCVFPTEPPVKQLTMNFRRGEADPTTGPRFLGSLVVDSTGLDTEVNYSLINVFGEAAGAELQLRGIASGETPEVIADTRAVPEPGQIVQLLSGLFGLAGLSRLRRKH